VILRWERETDHVAIRQVHMQSFPTAAEGDLVERLRAEGDIILSLVGEEAGQVMGHVLFSRMTSPQQALGLGPVAVLPAFRRRGVAARLIEMGLREAAVRDWRLVFVLGAPAYYGRFGFSTARAAGFSSPYAGPHFMAHSLGAAEAGGSAEYAPAFAGLE
jgi:putative acetyltransferase